MVAENNMTCSTCTMAMRKHYIADTFVHKLVPRTYTCHT